MTDWSQFEIVGDDTGSAPVSTPAPAGPDLSQFEIVGADTPGVRTWGDTFSNLGKSFARGSTGLAGSVIDYNPLSELGQARLGEVGSSLIDSLLGTRFSRAPSALVDRAILDQSATLPALDEARQKQFGNPDYSKANWPERYAGAAVETLPGAAIGGGVLPAIASGLVGEGATDLGLPRWSGQIVGGVGTGMAQDGLSAAAENGPAWADTLENKALGIGKGDLTLSGRRSGLDAFDYVTNEDGTTTRILSGDPETKLESSLRAVKEDGLFENGTNPEAVWTTAQSKADGLSKKIGEEIAAADEARQGVPVEPSFENAERYIENEAPAVDKEFLRDRLANIKQSIKDEGDGSYAFLQNEKVKLTNKTYAAGKEAAKDFDKQVGLDLRQTIEGGAPEVGPLNQKLGQYLEVLPKLTNTLSKEGAKNPFEFASNLTRTTGGIAGTAILGGVLGHGSPIGAMLGAALGGAIRYGGSPGGLMNQAKALRWLSSTAPSVPAGLAASALPLTAAPALVSALQGSRGSDTASPQLSTRDMRSISPQIARQAPTSVPMSPARGPSNQANGVSSSQDPRPNPVSSQSVNDLIAKQPPLVRAFIKVESSNNEKAVGPKTKYGQAKGLMQLMDETSKRHGVDDPFNPGQNIKAGTDELKAEIVKWKDPYIGFAAYNAGDPAIEAAIAKAKAKGVAPTWANIQAFLPKETREYPSKIVAALAGINKGAS
jgi:soluble lytic murein transglycosylase-like protein